MVPSDNNLHAPGASPWVDEDLRESIAELGIRTIEDGWSDLLQGEIVHDRGERQVIRLAAPDGEHSYYLKRWRVAPYSPKRYLPLSFNTRYRTRNEFGNLTHLKELGLTVPKPIFFAEKKGVWGPDASILLLVELQPYTCCLELADQEEHRERIAIGIAEILGQLHSNDLFYRSPGLKHFYLHNTDTAASLALLDVAGIQKQPTGLRKHLQTWIKSDMPGRNRDLSKVTLTLRGELGAADSVIDSFWSAYGKIVGLDSDSLSSCRKEAEEDASWRLMERKKRFAPPSQPRA